MVKKNRNAHNTRSIISEIDPSKRINDSTWVVSLVRNSHAYRNTEHVFIVLEAKDGRRAKTYFMDFVAERPIDLALPGIRPGKIRFHVQEGLLTKSLVYSCPLPLMQLVPGRQISSYSCNLDRALCENLVEKVLRASKAAIQPQYNALGNESVFAQGSALSSFNEVGHSCFSWAYQQLEELNDPELMESMPQSFNDPLRFIIRIPSRALPTDSHLQLQRLSQLKVALLWVDSWEKYINMIPFIITAWVILLWQLVKDDPMAQPWPLLYVIRELTFMLMEA